MAEAKDIKPTGAVKELGLKVAEATQDDVNKGIVRIDSGFMREIDARPGDIVEIQGERKTVAITDRAYPGDIGLNIIRMDGIIRRNAKTGIGELVKVRKADVKEAKKVTIAPATKGVFIKASPEIFKQGLLGRAVVKGDIVSLGGTKRRRTTMSSSPFFEDIFSDIFEENIMGFNLGGISELKFIVADTMPKQAVVITDETEVTYNPEAVEVAEERVPEVTYEDIGGLTDEIKKIREMVELPLKHPEIFQRLGIEPPKGVLLHGPPGTGKTLLAKAVANESNSHFILINGPEIMCVDGETPILTNPKGFVKAKEIYEQGGKAENFNSHVVKKLDIPISTYAFKDGVVEKANITHVTKLKSDAFNVKLNDGNELIVSENQPFLVYRNGGLVWDPLKNIKEGDFIARANKITLPEESYTIPLNDIKKKFCLVEKEGKYTVKSRNLSRSNFIRLPERTSPELLESIGLLVSDGNISNKGDSIGFYNKDIDLIKRFKYLMNKVFEIENFKEKNKADMFGVIVYSKLLVEYLEILGFSNANKENIPPYFFRLPKSEVEAFVRGYFDGDGTVSRLKIKNMVYPTPVLYAVNKEFLMPLQSLMLLKLGIQCRIKKHNTPKGLMHKLVVRGHEGRVRFLGIGATSRHKLERLQEIRKTIKIKEHENIPHPSLLIEAIRNNLQYKKYRNKDYYIYKTGNATKHSLNVLYKIASENNILNDALQKEFALLLREDIGWEKVEQITRVGIKELYDFTVDKDSFIGAPYFFLHNSKYYGQSEENIRKKFEEAEKEAPSIIFIDEIDAIAPKREDTRGEVERRVVAQLLAMMDGLKSRGKVVVIAATNVPNILDPALRRPGRFDREVEIGVPNKEGRLNVLKIHTRNMPLDKDVDLNEIAAVTHGFVGADLAALAKESAMIILRRILPEIKLREEEPISKEVLEKLIISKNDFKDALKIVRPSALREVFVETPNVRWTDIGGLNDVKQQLIEAVEWPLKFPDAFKTMGVRPPRGILLYGAPGTGKTLLAKAVAKETESNFILVKGPELISKWVGESEKAVREVFKKARQTAPCIIFFDEIDSLAPRRGISSDAHVTERVVNQMLTEMDGLEDLNDVVIIAATNRPDMLDTALLRPGRFDRLILTSVPELETRKKIFEIHTKGMPIKIDKDELKKAEEGLKDKKINLISKMAADEPITESDLPKTKKGSKENLIKFKELSDKDKMLFYLAAETEGFVGADIEALCREAAMLALRKDIKSKEVTMKHFEEAMKSVRPSVTKDVEKAYDEIKDSFRAARGKEMKEEKPSYMG